MAVRSASQNSPSLHSQTPAKAGVLCQQHALYQVVWVSGGLDHAMTDGHVRQFNVAVDLELFKQAVAVGVDRLR